MLKIQSFIIPLKFLIMLMLYLFNAVTLCSHFYQLLVCYIFYVRVRFLLLNISVLLEK